MKRLLSLLIVCTLVFTACASQNQQIQPAATADASETTAGADFSELEDTDFSGLGDPALSQHLIDSIYTILIDELDSDAYFIENVEAIYISKEYLDELAFNSQENIYFGYNLFELNEQYQGARFIFTLGDDNQTIVQEFEAYDDTFDKIVRNVAIGSGVILLCVTVSVVTGGAAAPAVCLIFATSAKTAAIGAGAGGVISGAAAGIITGIETKDFNESMKAAALAGSEGFMWGAIAGAITGGASSAIALRGATLNGLSMNEAAMIQRESKYPLDVIKEFKTYDQYKIAKEAGLRPVKINGKMNLVRDIDLNYADEFGRSNLQRMKEGLAALDPKTGQAYELHHIGQKADSTLAILTKAEHMQGGNNTIWHEFGSPSAVHGTGNTWDVQRIAFWKDMARALGGG